MAWAGPCKKILAPMPAGSGTFLASAVEIAQLDERRIADAEQSLNALQLGQGITGCGHHCFVVKADAGFFKTFVIHADGVANDFVLRAIIAA